MNNGVVKTDDMLQPLISHLLCTSLCQFAFGALILLNWYGSYRAYYTEFPILETIGSVFAVSSIIVAVFSFFVRGQINHMNQKSYKAVVLYTTVYFVISTFSPLIYVIICDAVVGTRFWIMDMPSLIFFAAVTAKSIRCLLLYKDGLKEHDIDCSQ